VGLQELKPECRPEHIEAHWTKGNNKTLSSKKNKKFRPIARWQRTSNFRFSIV
jgi:hypothetical protein